VLSPQINFIRKATACQHSFIPICDDSFAVGMVNFMKTQELVLICRYSEMGQSVAQIIQSSFDTFLRKELQIVAKCL